MRSSSRRSVSRLAAALVAAGAVTGCVAPRAGEPPAIPVTLPPAFHSHDGGTGTAGPEWHRAFGDPALDACVARVLAGNTSLKIAWQRLEQARLAALEAGVAGRPQAALEAGVERSRSRERVSGPDRYTHGTSWSGRGTLTWELDLWGRVAALRRAGRLEFEASREDRNATTMLLVLRTTEAWLRWRACSADLALLREQIASSKQYLALNELRLEQGGGSALDVWMQRAQLLELRAQIPELERQQAREANQLALLAGGELFLGDGAPELPPLPPAPALPAPADLIHTRPELRAAWSRLLAEDARVAAAVADRLPQIGLSLDGLLESPTLSDPARLATLLGGVSGSLPVLDGGRRRLEVERQRAASRERLWEFAERLLGSVAEVQEAAIDDAHLGRTADALAARLAAAESALEEARARHLAGQSTYLAVLDALRTRQEAQRACLGVETDRRLARARLYSALGFALEEES